MSKHNRQPQHGGLPAQRNSPAQLSIRQKQFIGPLPSPEALAEFDHVIPGLAERIVSMAEGHAQDAWRTNRAGRIVAIMGQIFAFVVIITALGVGTYLTKAGLSVPGVATILTAIAAPAAAMIRVRTKKNT